MTDLMGYCLKNGFDTVISCFQEKHIDINIVVGGLYGLLKNYKAVIASRDNDLDFLRDAISKT
jgi:hypothetical protein